MELEHAFQRSEFMVAWLLFIATAFAAPGVLGGDYLYQRFVGVMTSYVVSFGPMVLLVYVLYHVSLLN